MEPNTKLVPIKLHFFFFMGAMGPILPQLPIFGKDLGISPVVMGTVTGILPFVFLLMKPLFGLLVDIYRDRRKTIFVLVIIVMTLSFAILFFTPQHLPLKFEITAFLEQCSREVILSESECNNKTIPVVCSSQCLNESTLFLASSNLSRICTLNGVILSKNTACSLSCVEDIERDNGCLYKSFTVWNFILFMSVGTIGFNIINSISDAICFDIVGEQQADYGKQRVWGSIGFGLTALFSGYMTDTFSTTSTNYAPLFIIMLIWSTLDLISCIKLELPIMKAPENIFKDLKLVFINSHVIVFIIFTVLAGMIDSLIIYFLFWYLEDTAKTTNTTNIKLLEGLIIAAETLGGETILFLISGLILQRLGHINCFTFCFINYAVRFALISVAPSPWWILLIELFMQGPTFALTYTTIVAYANELAPPGTSATMQGIATGMGDGTGYAVGSIIGGLLYKYLGGKLTFQVFAAFAFICGIVHFSLHKTVLRKIPHQVTDRADYERID